MLLKEAWSFYRTIFVVRLCWELEEPEGPARDRPKGLGSLLRKVEVFAFVGLVQNLKDRKHSKSGAFLMYPVTCDSVPQVPKRSVGVVPESRSPRAERDISLLEIVRPEQECDRSLRIPAQINSCW